MATLPASPAKQASAKPASRPRKVPPEADLLVAIRTGHISKVRQLLSRGAEPSLRALREAIHGRFAMITDLLIEAGAPFFSFAETLIKDAADSTGREWKLDLVLKHIDKLPYPATLLTAAQSHAPTMRRLLQRGLDPNGQDFAAELSPLASAVANRHVESALLLIDAGANPNWRHPKYFSILHLACKHANLTRIVERLLAAGVDPNPTGYTSPLVSALLCDAIGSVKFLLEAGATPDVLSVRAAYTSCPRAIPALLLHGADFKHVCVPLNAKLPLCFIGVLLDAGVPLTYVELRRLLMVTEVTENLTGDELRAMAVANAKSIAVRPQKLL